MSYYQATKSRNFGFGLTILPYLVTYPSGPLGLVAVFTVRRKPLRIPRWQKDLYSLYRMVKIGAITPESEPTEWVSQMVAARKKDGMAIFASASINL